MSVSATANKIVYSGDGVTTAFPFSFPLPAGSTGSDIVVIVFDASGVATVLGSNYSVNTVLKQVNYPTVGGVSPLAVGINALPVNWSIVLARIEPLSQALALTNQGVFDAAAINNELDKLTMICQQLQEQIDRCPKYPINSLPTATQLNPTTLTFTVAPIYPNASMASLRATAALAPTTQFFAVANDLGSVGQLVWYFGNTGVGDGGFIILGGG